MTAPTLGMRVAAALASDALPHGAQVGPSATTRVAVLGASGYTGQEFVRLALRHPGLSLALLATRDGERTAAELVRGLDPRSAPPARVVTLDHAPHAVEAEGVELLVSCLPHGAWAERGAAFPSGVRVVDLSADRRHDAPTEGYVYGLPEAFRGAIAGAARVANPGCYPTATALALLPALEAGWIDDPIAVSAVSGVSGAGRGPALRTSFVEREGAELYRAGSEHAHVAEMERHLGRVAGSLVRIGFAPVLAPMSRGILAVAQAPLSRTVSAAEAVAAWKERYDGEPFVHLLPAGAWPDTAAVRGSNRADVAVTTLHAGRTLLAAAAIDNLVKGAAGQALQNVNLMLGWPETTGLPKDGVPW